MQALHADADGALHSGLAALVSALFGANHQCGVPGAAAILFRLDWPAGAAPACVGMADALGP